MPTRKIYVGSAVNLWKRWEQHRRSLRKGQHGDRHLQAAWNKSSFINPNGERVVIINLSAFCRANGLHPVKMHNLKNGKIQRYKGWTWREEEEHGE